LILYYTLNFGVNLLSHTGFKFWGEQGAPNGGSVCSCNKKKYKN